MSINKEKLLQSAVQGLTEDCTIMFTAEELLIAYGLTDSQINEIVNKSTQIKGRYNDDIINYINSLKK